MKKITTIVQLAVFLFIIGSIAQAQTTIEFNYDASGNRTERKVIILKSVQQEETPLEEEKYEELLGEHEITIYPNPTAGKLAVHITNLLEVSQSSFALFNMSGRKITAKYGLQETTEIDITSQPPGMYILNIVLDDEKTTWKVVKK